MGLEMSARATQVFFAVRPAKAQRYFHSHDFISPRAIFIGGWPCIRYGENRAHNGTYGMAARRGTGTAYELLMTFHAWD